MTLNKLTLAVLVAAATAVGAQAQSYPERPVRVMVGFGAGSGPDILTRAVAAQLSSDLGQQFVVENRPGANGTIATRTLVQSDPDGHTLMYSSSSITPTPYIYKSLPYDLLKDVRPIATVGVLDGLLMLVNPSLPVKTVPEFIEYAKNNRVLYGSPGVGNALHVAAELFNVNAKLEMQHVPYKGAGHVAAALLANEIHVMFVTPPSVEGLIKAGKLRPIAATASKPMPSFPDVPLMKASLPSYPITSSWGMFYAPGKTPDAIVNKLNAAVQKAIAAPAVATVLQRAGYVPDGRDAAATTRFFHGEVAAAGEAVRAAKIPQQ
jgi:tripartite-type tricarboxylate transporter receptor subunit TctC